MFPNPTIETISSSEMMSRLKTHCGIPGSNNATLQILTDHLDKEGIRYTIHVRRRGDFIVTQPHEYHMVVSPTPSTAFSMNYNFDYGEQAGNNPGLRACSE
ncbi:uncharacterized protein BKA55DRAFT_83879 [Fusarium redolens]|jgi:hypothetical protein|uniref:JmjC domain-containing protein n=1 Tax=Fusarium redolens TaxID=48865 RepID=A0A9P9GTE4_FUSRE|nr:uncharacterized protein BKA55DRAFT_83879 [Fusarium redolens]KAH7244373.1 hypothetical protein BKA55DRAFT_83879 [Fusarium redolens]